MTNYITWHLYCVQTRTCIEKIIIFVLENSLLSLNQVNQHLEWRSHLLQSSHLRRPKTPGVSPEHTTVSDTEVRVDAILSNVYGPLASSVYSMYGRAVGHGPSLGAGSG
jgi:hypothetical protein